MLSPVPHAHGNAWYSAAKQAPFTSSFNPFSSSGYRISAAMRSRRAHE